MNLTHRMTTTTIVYYYEQIFSVTILLCEEDNGSHNKCVFIYDVHRNRGQEESFDNLIIILSFMKPIQLHLNSPPQRKRNIIKYYEMKASFLWFLLHFPQE